MEVPMNILPLSVVKGMIQVHVNFQEEMERRRPKRDVSYPTDANLEEVAEALQLIPPWQVGYDEWVKILAALYHSFGDAALPVAERWADGDENQVARKWPTFKSVSGKPATVGSIFDIAKRFGWRKSIAQT